MKEIRKFRYMVPAVLSLAVASCSLYEYTPGEPDAEDCYRVYFDISQSGRYEVDMDATASLTFKASRMNVEGAIKVPVTVKTNEDGIFSVTDIAFADGEAETSFTILFGQAELQKEYSATISVEDPAYARKYGMEDTSLEISVIRSDYKPYATGTYSCGILVSPRFTATLEYSESIDTYRFASLLSKGYHYPFKWDGGNVIYMLEDSYDTGLPYEEDGTNYGNIHAEPLKVSYDVNTKTFTFTFDYTVPGLGNFGEYDDSFTIGSLAE